MKGLETLFTRVPDPLSAPFSKIITPISQDTVPIFIGLRVRADLKETLNVDLGLFLVLVQRVASNLCGCSITRGGGLLVQFGEVYG